MRRVLPILMFLLLSAWPAHAQSGFIVIVHGETNVTSMDRKTIKDIFTGKKTVWDDGARIIFAILERGETHNLFMRKMVAKNPFQFMTFWKQQIFLGKAPRMPMVWRSMDEMIHFVSGTPGGIGYISAEFEKTLSGATIKKVEIVQ